MWMRHKNCGTKDCKIKWGSSNLGIEPRILVAGDKCSWHALWGCARFGKLQGQEDNNSNLIVRRHLLKVQLHGGWLLVLCGTHAGYNITRKSFLLRWLIIHVASRRTQTPTITGSDLTNHSPVARKASSWNILWAHSQKF